MSATVDTPVPATEPSKPLPKVFVATPCYGAMMHLSCAKGLYGIQLAARNQKVDLMLWQQGGESHINRARNMAVAEFLKTDFTHLFFIDADISFEVDDFAKVISAAVANDFDVVAGAYPIKEIRWEAAAKASAEGRDPHREASRIVVHRIDIETNSRGYVDGFGDCLEVKECGTGFMCISRKCIEAMIAAHPEVEYTHDTTPERQMWNLFHSDIRDDIFNGKPIKRWLSEDYWFCRTWRDLGGKIWLHLGVNLGHFGQYEHRGNPHEVHGGPQRGLRALPNDRERVMDTLRGAMMPTCAVTAEPRLIVDHEAKEGSFAIWAGLRWPNVVFDLYEPDPTLRSFLKENFAMYGLKGDVRERPPVGVTYARPYWAVNDGKVEVLT